MSDLAPRSNSTIWQTVVVLSKDKTNFKVGCLYRFLTGVTQLRKHFVAWIGKTLVAETLSFAREIRRST